MHMLFNFFPQFAYGCGIRGKAKTMFILFHLFFLSLKFARHYTPQKNLIAQSPKKEYS